MQKKRIPAALLVLLAAILIPAALAGLPQDTYAGETLTNEDFLRFHVVANSNDPEDQWLKYHLRDELLSFIHLELARELTRISDGTESPVSFTVTEVAEVLHEKNEQILQKARDVLQKEGCTLPVTVKLGLRHIPEKTYGTVTFPEGTYYALTVTIGKGEGENWWCCLFPPLCLLNAGSGGSTGEAVAAAGTAAAAALDLTTLPPAQLEALGLSNLTQDQLRALSAYYTHILSQEKYKILSTSDGRLQLRFKTLDWLRSR